MTNEDSSQLLAAKAALKLLQENAEMLEFAEELTLSFVLPIKDTKAEAMVSMVVRIVEAPKPKKGRKRVTN